MRGDASWLDDNLTIAQAQLGREQATVCCFTQTANAQAPFGPVDATSCSWQTSLEGLAAQKDYGGAHHNSQRIWHAILGFMADMHDLHS
ncbi:hypothetical protein O181_032386 [Austropuccinia psidii MF-1]|uniref:Uncharacterized protein n=1 Tax=Austropuccinia psidii MF-1 TaxID=1389203 RepID=A0A9Q3H636_9BASI|nr:hypothetical protein [Austropuccinia psidii MF-1]